MNSIKNQEDTEFVKIDLHIHTPASSCFKNEKNDDTYLKILRKAKNEKIKIISITDHNSIEGYKKLQLIYKQLNIKLSTLSTITDSTQTTHIVKEIEDKLSLFQDILILPGIEFEVKNGIHMLVIFNQNISIDKIERFLIDGGYTRDCFGEETPSSLSKWGILDLFEESKNYDCLLIDAHTDSNKGILNTIPSGLFRANCFKSSQLHAIGYNSEKQKAMLQRTIETSKDYKRDTTLSFVKFSDAHKISEIGSRFTWVKLEEVNFLSLKNAFLNPQEMVSTEKPSLEKILNQLLNQNNTVKINNLSEDNVEYLKKAICALNNTEGGHTLLGVTKMNNKIGLSMPTDNLQGKEKRNEYLDKIIECIKQIEGEYSRPKITSYTLQNGNVIFSIHITKNNELINILKDNRIFQFINKEILILTAREIQDVVEERNTERIKYKIQKRVSFIEKECRIIKTYFSAISLIKKFDQNSVKYRAKIEVSNSLKLKKSDIIKLRAYSINGKSKGNIFYMKGYQPRLPYAYLRYSLPLSNLSSLSYKSEKKDTIYIVPGGAVYFSERNYPFFDEDNRLLLKLFPKNSNLYSNKFLVCYFKSSFLIWYCQNKLDSFDFHLPSIYNSIRFPVINQKDPKQSKLVEAIEHKFDEILVLEKQCLIESQKLEIIKRDEYIKNHNLKICKLAYEIDHNIFDLLNLSKEEINIIEENLKLNQIFLPPSLPI
jgi:predicted metal-dependent phosphoesterase TrpH